MQCGLWREDLHQMDRSHQSESKLQVESFTQEKSHCQRQLRIVNVLDATSVFLVDRCNTIWLAKDKRSQAIPVLEQAPSPEWGSSVEQRSTQAKLVPNFQTCSRSSKCSYTITSKRFLLKTKTNMTLKWIVTTEWSIRILRHHWL